MELSKHIQQLFWQPVAEFTHTFVFFSADNCHLVSPPRLFLARGNRYRRIGTELKNTGLVFPVGAMEAAGAAFWRDTIAATIEMRIGSFLHQDLKCEKGVWNHKSYLRCDKKIAPVLFHSCVVQYRGYPVEYFVICCDLLSRARLQLTAVIQLVLWMLAKSDKISETPVFSRLSDLAPIIT